MDVAFAAYASASGHQCYLVYALYNCSSRTDQLSGLHRAFLHRTVAYFWTMHWQGVCHLMDMRLVSPQSVMSAAYVSRHCRNNEDEKA